MQNRFGFPVLPLVTAFHHPAAQREVVALLHTVAVSLGLRPADAHSLRCVIEETLRENTPHAERDIRAWITSRAEVPQFVAGIDARSAQIRSQIQPFVNGRVIADIGCGDGLVASGLDGDHETFLVDVVDYVDSRVTLPFFLYSGRGALPGQQADCSLLLTVLHHSDDPHELLRETRRITAHRMIVIESVVPEISAPDCESQFLVAAFFDWFYNRVLHEEVPVPFNYNSVSGWRDLLDQDEWRTVQVIDLGRDQRLVPERHVLFVVDRVAAGVSSFRRLAPTTP